MGYSTKYIDHFTNPRGIGEIEPPDAVSEVKHAGGGCFDTIRLTLKIDNEMISDARFRARACSGTIAACSALVDKVSGMELNEAIKLTPDDIADHLDGIPEKKRHSVELAVEALQTAITGRTKSEG
ncbi:MAG: iron-sulfur cluster assembly scaffold protein [Candidatus Hatepunaea meridiana]|nr:iron-sulfur cluster assembly scaffold protein [Candidatus Hatepunaea meridiana]